MNGLKAICPIDLSGLLLMADSQMCSHSSKECHKARVLDPSSLLSTPVEKHLPNVHGYVDDSQLYLAFSPDILGDDKKAINAMRECINEIRPWMIKDRLMLNDNKTEFILLGTRHQLAQVNINSIIVG